MRCSAWLYWQASMWSCTCCTVVSVSTSRVDHARLQAGRAVQVAVVVLADQRHHPAVEVAEVVRQVGVVHVREALPAELAVAGERALAQEVVAERLGAELA